MVSPKLDLYNTVCRTTALFQQIEIKQGDSMQCENTVNKQNAIPVPHHFNCLSSTEHRSIADKPVEAIENNS